MAKKELNYNDLAVNMILVVKSEFEHAHNKYKKNEKVTITKLDDEAHSITIVKNGKEYVFCMYEVIHCFRKPKYKNRNITKAVAVHEDVRLVIANGNTIIVELDTEFKGVATCDDECIFNERNGYMIAYFKAKKKEADYRYRADRHEYQATIKAAQLMIENIDKNHIRVDKQYDFFIKRAIAEVEVKPPLPKPF